MVGKQPSYVNNEGGSVMRQSVDYQVTAALK